MSDLPVFGMPSRELDAAVAEYVMKWKWHEHEGQKFLHNFANPERLQHIWTVSAKYFPHYSTDIKYAWEVAEKLSLNDYSFRCGIDGLLQPWAAIRHNSEGSKGSPKDGALVCAHHTFGIPYVICLAALETEYANE